METPVQHVLHQWAISMLLVQRRGGWENPSMSSTLWLLSACIRHWLWRSANFVKKKCQRPTTANTEHDATPLKWHKRKSIQQSVSPRFSDCHACVTLFVHLVRIKREARAACQRSRKKPSLTKSQLWYSDTSTASCFYRMITPNHLLAHARCLRMCTTADS